MRRAITDNPEWVFKYGLLFLKSLDDRIPSNGSRGGKMAAYMLKDVPDDLWREARKKAIDCEITMKDLLIQLLREWIEKKE